MDPTKSFDHLDPKLKETYARVMGTTASPSDGTTQSMSSQPDTSLSATPPGGPDQAQNTNPNPGTGPTITSMPADSSSLFSTTPSTPAVDNNAPATSSFFSNPSPATTDPTQAQPAVDASAAGTMPATPAPFTPETYSINPSAGAESFAQPLPSPATVNQAPREASPLLRVLYIVGGVIFFAIYTIFWIKVFNLPIPFLNF